MLSPYSGNNKNFTTELQELAVPKILALSQGQVALMRLCLDYCLDAADNILVLLH